MKPTKGNASCEPPVDLVFELTTFLQNSFSSPARAILAISGGADSVALLRAWHGLPDEVRVETVVATFDHGLRKESADDAAFVETLASRLGFSFALGRPSAPLNTSEASARRARYEFLTDLARARQASVVVTAHTRDDQVETLLFRLLRGTGPAGLAGIPARRLLAPGIALCRPFLAVTRAQIERFLIQLAQDYRHDASNDSLTYRRNRIRRELLPYLRDHFNPQVDDALLRLAQLGDEQRQVAQTLANTHLGEIARDPSTEIVLLPIKLLVTLGKATAGHLIKLVIEREGWPRREIGKKEIDRILALVDQKSPPVCELPGRLRACRANASGNIELGRVAPRVNNASAPFRAPPFPESVGGHNP